MSRIPGSKMADDVATRFEVPIEGSGISLPQLFSILSSSDEFSQYTVEKSSLESFFIKVIRENNVTELERSGRVKSRWCF
jgi:ATP-binding cassette, subfamily A (ABC1), member 3